MYLVLAIVLNIVIPGYKDITLHIFFLVLFLVIKSAFRYMVLSGICMDRLLAAYEMFSPAQPIRFIVLLYPPQTVFVGGYSLREGILFSRCPTERTNDRPTERVSVTFCFLNNFKNH